MYANPSTSFDQPFGSPTPSEILCTTTTQQIDSTQNALPSTSNASSMECNEADEFGKFVAQSLKKLPAEIQRRQLEIEIETAILDAKKAAFSRMNP